MRPYAKRPMWKRLLSRALRRRNYTWGQVDPTTVASRREDQLVQRARKNVYAAEVHNTGAYQTRRPPAE